MIPTDAVLDALADCLESGDTLVEALEKVATAGGEVQDWTRHVLRSVRANLPLARALGDSNVVDAEELSLLLAGGADASAARALRAVVARRQRGRARRRAIRAGLVAPLALGALTVALDPLPDLITGGAYLWPVLRGLFVLLVLTIAVVAGAPVLLRHPMALRLCAATPGVRRLAALHAEEELTTTLAPFAEHGEVTAAGLGAVASLLAWSPLSEPLRDAARSVRAQATPLAMGGPMGGPMGGLDPVARHLSVATDLAIVGGVASKRLTERLARRGEAVAQQLTARLRLVTRIGAYGLLVLFSVSSVLGMISRGLPGMPTLPGG